MDFKLLRFNVPVPWYCWKLRKSNCTGFSLLSIFPSNFCPLEADGPGGGINLLLELSVTSIATPNELGLSAATNPYKNAVGTIRYFYSNPK